MHIEQAGMVGALKVGLQETKLNIVTGVPAAVEMVLTVVVAVNGAET